MTRQQLIKKINKRICGLAPGFFSDNFWAGERIVSKELHCIEGVNVTLNNTQYQNDDKGTPIAKRWIYDVTDGQKSCYVIIIASGAGTVTEPLSRYDIVSYAY